MQNFLTFVEITGDFFAHPESAIASVESFLQGKQIDFDANRLAEEIQILLDNNSYLLIGISARDIAEVVKEAVVK